MTKRELKRLVDQLEFGLDRCSSRVRRLETAIAQFLEAEDASEMSNRAIAIAHLRHLLERI